MPFWDDFPPDPARYPHGATIAGNRFRIQDLLGGSASAGRFWGWSETHDGVLITVSRQQRRPLEDVAADLALDFGCLLPVEAVAPLDAPAPWGEQLVALVEMEPAGETLSARRVPPARLVPVLATLASTLIRLVDGGGPILAVNPDAVYLSDPDTAPGAGGPWMAGRTDAFLAGAVPLERPESGTLLWRHVTNAPELLADGSRPPDGAALAWSLAVTAVIAASGRHPIPGGDESLPEHLRSIRRGHVRTDVARDLPPEAASLVLGALSTDPEARPPLHEFAALGG